MLSAFISASELWGNETATRLQSRGRTAYTLCLYASLRRLTYNRTSKLWEAYEADETHIFGTCWISRFSEMFFFVFSFSSYLLFSVCRFPPSDDEDRHHLKIIFCLLFCRLLTLVVVVVDVYTLLGWFTGFMKVFGRHIMWEALWFLVVVSKHWSGSLTDVPLLLGSGIKEMWVDIYDG